MKYILSDKSNESQDAPSRVEVGNANLEALRSALPDYETKIVFQDELSPAQIVDSGS